MQNICPKHNKPLKRFEGISKKTGLPYGNWKCTAKVGEGWCDTIIWDEDEVLTKKFTQTPNGVVETEEVWPPEAPVTQNPAPGRTQPSNSDIMDAISRLGVKINKLLNESENI